MDSVKVTGPTQINVSQDWLDSNLTESTGYESSDTITLTSTDMGASLSSPYTYSLGAMGAGFSNATYTTAGAGSNVPWLTSAHLSSPKIKLDGENADIEVNGWSLVDAVKRIEERLGLFQPNPELEKEWEELRALGDQYRQLEQHIKDKQDTWDRLKAMPKIDID